MNHKCLLIGVIVLTVSIGAGVLLYMEFLAPEAEVDVAETAV